MPGDKSLAAAVAKQAAGPKPEDDMNIGLESAVDDFAAALGVSVKDKPAAVAALKDFVRLCDAGPYEGEE